MSLSWTGAGTGGPGRPGLGAETVQDRFLICITRPHHTSATSTDIWSSGKRRGGRGRNTQCSDEREILKKSKTSSSENARLTGEAPSCATLTYRCRCWWWSELRAPKKVETQPVDGQRFNPPKSHHWPILGLGGFWKLEAKSRKKRRRFKS